MYLELRADRIVETGEQLRDRIRERFPKANLGRVADAFVFINLGETHVPYWHEGADWDRSVNPCRPFGGESNDAAECARRQLACLEWVDDKLGPLLSRFAHANTLVCADHGDAWGEDGLWEHGIHHPAVMDVPLVFRLQHAPVTMTSTATKVRGLARKLKNKLS